MDVGLLIRLGITAVVVFGIFFQFPRFVRKVTQIAEEGARDPANRRSGELPPETVARQVRNAKISLLSGYALLLLVAWMIPL